MKGDQEAVDIGTELFISSAKKVDSLCKDLEICGVEFCVWTVLFRLLDTML